jgi:hypothetical protein
VPLDDPAGKAEVKVTLQVNKAPTVLSGAQLIDETPLPISAAVAATPAGN